MNMLMKWKKYLNNLKKMAEENPKVAKEKSLKALKDSGVVDENGNLKEQIVTESHCLTFEKLDIYTVGSFLIHLYDKLNDSESYSCSQLKLNKMIILANLEYYRKYSEKMNELNLYFDKDYGYNISNNIFFRSPITVSKKSKDEPLSKEEIEKLFIIKSSNIAHFKEEDILNNTKSYEVLLSTFIKYASFSTRTLDTILNKSKEMIKYIFLSVNNDISFIKLSDQTKANLERLIGISLEELNNLSVEEQDRYVEKRIGKKLKYGYARRYRFKEMDEVDKGIDGIIKTNTEVDKTNFVKGFIIKRKKSKQDK